MNSNVSGLITVNQNLLLVTAPQEVFAILQNECCSFVQRMLSVRAEVMRLIPETFRNLSTLPGVLIPVASYT